MGDDRLLTSAPARGAHHGIPPQPRTIPDGVLAKMAAIRPDLAERIALLRAEPERAMELERVIAWEFLGGEVPAPMTALEAWYLAASSAGHPYGRWVDLDYAAHLSGLSPDHLRRLCIAGQSPAIKWRGQWYADREALPERQRQPR